MDRMCARCLRRKLANWREIPIGRAIPLAEAVVRRFFFVGSFTGVAFLLFEARRAGDPLPPSAVSAARSSLASSSSLYDSVHFQVDEQLWIALHILRFMRIHGLNDIVDAILDIAFI